VNHEGEWGRPSDRAALFSSSSIRGGRATRRLAICAVAIAALGAACGSPAAPDSGVTIEYIAHACFRITSPGGTTLMVDPYESRWWLGYDFPSDLPPVDGVLISHPHPDHDGGYTAGKDVAWNPEAAVITDPGRYQFDDMRVTGIRGQHAPPYGEEFGRKNTIWVIETGGLRIVHIGDNAPLTDEVADEIGHVDILMIPVDDLEHLLSHEDVEVYRERLAPTFVIPMHYRHPDLEIDPDSPTALGGIDGWLARQEPVQRLDTNIWTVPQVNRDDPQTVVYFEHSPLVVRPPSN